MRRAILLFALSLLLAAPGLGFARDARAEEICAEGPEGLECRSAKPLDRAFVEGVVGAPQGEALQGAALAQRTHEVGLLLRCPVCQGTSVSDSPSSTAINMKDEVRDLLAEGYTEAQILAYFEAAYGQFVLLRPKSEGLGLLVWAAPLLFLGGGAFVVASALRRLRQPSGEEPLPAASEASSAGLVGSAAGAPLADASLPSRGQLPADEELAGWLLQVRELAYGWPGGKPPKETE